MTDTFTRLSAALAGRYRLERELGAGGMATVYLAEDLKHDRRVAIKVLRPEIAAVIGAERFLAEIRTTANLQHPNILPLFDSGSAAERPGAREFLYYVMPYVEGESLRDRLVRETRLSTEEAVRITAEVADALEYAHRRGVIHRDIKPENILLQDGRALIADFGIALTVDAADQHRLTETGLTIGTPGYMSPEQALGERALDQRSDIFSLGVVVYEMITGTRPFEGATAHAIVANILTEAPVPPSRRHPAVPPALDAAVLGALDKDPERRTASARAFHDALTTDPPSTGHPWIPRRRRWTGAVAALATTIVIVTSLVIYSRHPRAAPRTVARAAPDTAAVRLVNVAAYWLERRTQGGCEQAIPRYAEATTRDTMFVTAWAGLANADAICAMFGTANPFSGLVAARAAAEHALVLDSGSATAWTALGMTALFSEQAWDPARKDFERATALDSTTPWPWLYRAWTFLAVGRTDSAEASIRQAYRRAPTNNLIGARLAQILATRMNDSAAQRIAAEVLQRDSNDIQMRWTITYVALNRDRCRDALAGAEWLISRHALEPNETSSAYRMNRALVAAAWAKCGRAADARRYADSVATREAAGAYVDPWTQTIVYAALGDSARMFAELETALANHNWGLFDLRTEPLLDAYRNTPHFQDLMRRLHEI